MTYTANSTISGGEQVGVIGAGSVHIENFNVYSQALGGANTSVGPIRSCPYPGLAYFGPDDADVFFGRDAAIGRLTEAVNRHNLTAIVGASGCGKSSVVLAGLAPQLYRTGSWRFSHFRIGNASDGDAFLVLARALVPLYLIDASVTERLANPRQLATRIATGELTLRDILAACRERNKGNRILFIADQFEEVFTLVADDSIRHRFIDVLLEGFPRTRADNNLQACLVLTLRGDFYGQALGYRRLADALQGNVENLGPMTTDELRLAALVQTF
jgi:hypothetical protein